MATPNNPTASQQNQHFCHSDDECDLGAKHHQKLHCEGIEPHHSYVGKEKRNVKLIFGGIATLVNT